MFKKDRKRSSSSKIDLVKEPQKKKKKKERISATLLISVGDNDDDFFPCEYVVGKHCWDQFTELIKTKCEIGNKEKTSMKFYQKFGDKLFPSHLTQKTFDEFNIYVKKNSKNQADSPIQVKVLKIPNKDMPSVISQKASNQASTTTTDTVKNIIEGFEERNWEYEYCSSFDVGVRGRVFRKLLEPSWTNINCSLECGNSHTFKSINVGKVPSMEKLRALVTVQEMRCLVQKRGIIKEIYGNGDLLINCLLVQCPICGCIVSIGHINDIAHKKDHLYEHINSAHFKDPIRSTNRAAGYLLLKRHEQYFSNNKNMELPVAERCLSGGLHNILPVEVKGSRQSPWEKGNMRISSPIIEPHLLCKFCNSPADTNAEDLEVNIDILQKSRLSSLEFKDYASKILKHQEVFDNHRHIFFDYNAEVIVTSKSSASRNGLLKELEAVSNILDVSLEYHMYQWKQTVSIWIRISL